MRRPGWLSRVAVREAILPVVGARIAMLAFGALAVVVLRPEAIGDGFLGYWNRWDAPHFQEIARHGYAPPAAEARIVLLPALPALIALGSILVPPLVAGMLVALAASVVAAIGLHRLASADGGRAVGRAAVIAMLVFPTAFSLVAPYSESLFLAFTVWAWVHARNDRWQAAGYLAFLAALTRIQGVFIVPALLVEYLWRHRRLRRDAAWLLVGLVAPAIYLWINWSTFGSPFHFLEVQRETFLVRTIPPWEALGGLWNGLAGTPPGEFWFTVFLAPAGTFVVLAVAAAWTLVGRGSRPSYAAFMLLNLATFVTLSWPISVPRYSLTVFPVLLAAAHTVHQPWLATTLLVGSTLLLALLTALFVTGHWAF